MSYKIVHKVKDASLKKTGERRKELEARVAQDAVVRPDEDALLPQMELGKYAIKSLRKGAKRVRRSTAVQVERVMRSLQRFGQRVPIVIDDNSQIIDGHIVVEAMQKLGASHIMCVVAGDLSDADKALLHVTLNRLGETGEWNFDALGELMIDLSALDIDVSITGFSLPEIDVLMHSAQIDQDNASPAEADAVPDVAGQPVSVLGDIWLLGDHVLGCNDATRPESYEAVLGDDLVRAVMADCPWNIKVKGFVSSKHADFTMGAGEMTQGQFVEFAETFSRLCADRLEAGGAFFSWIDWRSVDVIIAAGKKADLTLINLAVWSKGGGGGMGSYLRSGHELAPIFCKGPKLAVNNVELGKHGRNRSNVWSYPGAFRKGSSANKAHASHPTPKSVEMVEDALLDVTRPGDLVLDPFLGSGTTLIAAERIGRKARCIELDPKYVDVAIRRWEELTGTNAVHSETQLSFAELARQRALDAAA